ncbi:class I SAM-dependent methyltransferase [Synechococcus sp. BS55D]|uniref:class I SAM-dependent methyltransferase n=1 Tax=Synechococcus sp. BS55D TaxID=2055943 RepID=UPI0013761C5E|nr:class I SAM-dependent methyltransferase [Synechococcus sp. BS55D]
MLTVIEGSSSYAATAASIIRYSGGPVSSIHIQLISHLVATNKQIHFFEVGTFTGLVPLVLADIYPSLKITTVDVPMDDPRNSYQYANSPTVVESINRGRSMINSLCNAKLILQSSQLLWKIIDTVPLIDIAWIDGDHTGLAPYNDILFALMRLNSGGVVLCDDVYLNQPDDPTILAIKQIAKDISLDIIAIQKRENDPHKFICCITRSHDMNSDIKARVECLSAKI